MHARKDAEESGRRILVVDAIGAYNFAGYRYAAQPRDILELWRPTGPRLLVFSPADSSELDQVLRAVRAGGELVLLVDEAHYYLSARSGSSGELLALMRSTQHSGCRVLCTTQHLSGDVPQAALACAPTLHLFRTTSTAALQILERHFAVDPARARTLARGDFLTYRSGFDSIDDQETPAWKRTPSEHRKPAPASKHSRRRWCTSPSSAPATKPS